MIFLYAADWTTWLLHWFQYRCKSGTTSNNPAYAASFPERFAAFVAKASISGGERQSYGVRPSSVRRPRTAPMLSGDAPDSMIDETNAAKVGAAQPVSFERSVCTKSRP